MIHPFHLSAILHPKFFIMKWFFGSLILLVFAFRFPYDQANLAVLDPYGKPIPMAKVDFFKGHSLVRTFRTDANGRSKLRDLANDTYTVVITKHSYQTTKVLGVVLAPNNQAISLVVKSCLSGLSESIVVNWRSLGEYDKDKDSGRKSKSRPLPVAMESVVPSEVAKKRASASLAYASTAVGTADGVIKDDKVGIEEGRPVSAGQLTAGEYNELDNWGHWKGLLDAEFKSFTQSWSMQFRDRIALQLIGNRQQALVDRAVRLCNAKGQALWEARTDNRGKAELWAAPFQSQAQQNAGAYEIFVQNDRRQWTMISSPEQGILINGDLNVLRLDADCTPASTNADVVFVVDATGSMGDEISYLKSELLDVAARIEGSNPKCNLRMGSLFYRDVSDEYLVQSSALSTGHALTAAFIKNQNAGGGGDFPEAVHAALDEAIYHQPWSQSAVARIIFLVLDAPPHQNAEVTSELQAQIRAAARAGIRIIPVTASGIDRSTEFLMKSFAVATGATYTFLTDHSGIGNGHLAPTADKFDVEKLNDLLVRIVNQSIRVDACDQQAVVALPEILEQALCTFFPNPTTDAVNIQLNTAIDEIALLASDGQVIKRLEQPAAGNYRWYLKNLPGATYIIRFTYKGRQESKQLVVVSS